MVKSPNSGQRDYISVLGGLDGPRVRGIFIQRQVSSGDMVIVEVIAKDSAQVPFVEDYHMIEALSANRSDNTFHIWVLPGRARRAVAGAVMISSMPRLLIRRFTFLP